MAQSEWEVWESAASLPGFESGFDGMCLRMTGRGTHFGTWYTEAQLKNTSSKRKGLTSGRLRASFWAIGGSLENGSIHTDFGLFFLADSNLPGVANFIAVYNKRQEVILVHCSGTQGPKGADPGGGGITLLGSAPRPYTPATIRTVQAQWIYTPPATVAIAVAIGMAEDYSDLEEVITATVSSFTMDGNHEAEGVYANQYDAASVEEELVVQVDNIELYYMSGDDG